MVRSKLQRISSGDSNRDIILSFLEADGEGMDLSDKQKEFLERWTAADELIRKYVGIKSREDIVQILMSRYGVCRQTAYSDIINAEFVFSSSKPLNKKYLIGVRIEFITKQIHAAQTVSDFGAVAQLEKILQGYIALYPETKINASPKTLIFNVDARSIKENVIETEDAEFIIDEALKQITEGAE